MRRNYEIIFNWWISVFDFGFVDIWSPGIILHCHRRYNPVENSRCAICVVAFLPYQNSGSKMRGNRDEWALRDDARTLMEAEKIKNDPARFAPAIDMGKIMAEEIKQEMTGLSDLDSIGQYPSMEGLDEG